MWCVETPQQLRDAHIGCLPHNLRSSTSLPPLTICDHLFQETLKVQSKIRQECRSCISPVLEILRRAANDAG